MDAKEAKTVISNLEKAKDSDTIIELLTLLEKEVKATEKFLRETKVGVSVNKLRSNSDPNISSLVKKIIKKWKDEVSIEKKKINKPKADPIKITNSKNSEEFSSLKPRNPANDGVKINYYDDSTRNGSISGLYTALAIESKKSPKIIVEISKEIEQNTFNLNKGEVSDGYRNKMRSLIMNLRNKKNPELRIRILNGDIKPLKFVKMSNAELAPDALKKEMADLHQKNLFGAQGAVEKRAVTDRFVCGKCKEREVSYYQMQTRSADEPLTTFCTCEKCGNRWKFC